MEKVSPSIDRNAFLFLWNSNGYSYSEKLLPKIKEFKETGSTRDTWSIGWHKKVKLGDRAFLTRVGNTDKKGIFASGTIICPPHPFINYEGKEKKGVEILFDAFLDPENEEILDLESLKLEIPSQDWSRRPSGTMINDFEKVETLWSNHITKENLFFNFDPSEQPLLEGNPYQLFLTSYERDRQARLICLKHHGYSCVVCGFNFKYIYGDIGNEFIHVHHLQQLSNIKGEHRVYPITDLCPVCPNCHAMLHTRKPSYSIRELKEIIEMQKNKKSNISV
jgi:5-methylcytosine-specific restriction protein A